MLHTEDFKRVLVKNKRLKDVGFKFTTILTFIRRLIDKAGLYNVVNETTQTLSVLEDEEFDKYDIVVDKGNKRVILEADLWDIGTIEFEKKKAVALEKLNRYNSELQFGFCLLVGSRVIYRITESIYMGVDDIEDKAVSDRILSHYEIDIELISKLRTT